VAPNVQLSTARATRRIICRRGELCRRSGSVRNRPGASPGRPHPRGRAGLSPHPGGPAGSCRRAALPGCDVPPVRPARDGRGAVAQAPSCRRRRRIFISTWAWVYAAMETLDRAARAVFAARWSCSPTWPKRIATWAPCCGCKGSWTKRSSVAGRRCGCVPTMRAGSNLVYTLYFHPGYDARAIFAEHAAWNRQLAEPLRGIAAGARRRSRSGAPAAGGLRFADFARTRSGCSCCRW